MSAPSAALARRWSGVERRLHAAAGVVERSGRRLAAAAGLPLRRPFLVLRCARGADVSGLFSEFAAVLGALEHFERWRPIYAGLRVDFGTEGLYYDPAHGPNWWRYHFEPVELGSPEGAALAEIDDRLHDAFAYRLPKLSRARGHALVARYVRPVERIRRRADAFVRDHLSGARVVGVHYRGTDKHHDAPRVPYERVAEAVLAEAARDGGDWKLFVATDEEAFVDFMRARFGARMACLDVRRSTDGGPIDVLQGDNFRKGEDAVLDCLLLSRCHRFVRTASNLGLAAMLFNPDLPVLELNRER